MALRKAPPPKHQAAVGRRACSLRRSRSLVIAICNEGRHGALRLDGRAEVARFEAVEFMAGCEEAIVSSVLDDDTRIDGSCFDNICSGHGASIATAGWRLRQEFQG